MTSFCITRPPVEQRAGSDHILLFHEFDAAVAKGEVEIGFRLVSVIVAAQDLDFVGPLPAAIQNYTSFAAGLVASSKQQDAGKALLVAALIDDLLGDWQLSASAVTIVPFSLSISNSFGR
jgi:hypothetical protein